MAYEMVMPYHLHMPSYFLETFTEYPEEKECSELLSVNFFVKSLFNFLKITFHIYIPIGH